MFPLWGRGLIDKYLILLMSAFIFSKMLLFSPKCRDRHSSRFAIFLFAFLLILMETGFGGGHVPAGGPRRRRQRGQARICAGRRSVSAERQDAASHGAQSRPQGPAGGASRPRQVDASAPWRGGCGSRHPA